MPTFEECFLVVSAVLLIVGACISFGNVGIVNSFHLKNVQNKNGYERATGMPLVAVGIFAMLIATVSKLLKSQTFNNIATVIFIAAFLAALVFIILAQKKYNRGIFSLKTIRNRGKK